MAWTLRRLWKPHSCWHRINVLQQCLPKRCHGCTICFLASKSIHLLGIIFTIQIFKSSAKLIWLTRIAWAWTLVMTTTTTKCFVRSDGAENVVRSQTVAFAHNRHIHFFRVVRVELSKLVFAYTKVSQDWQTIFKDHSPQPATFPTLPTTDETSDWKLHKQTARMYCV